MISAHQAILSRGILKPQKRLLQLHPSRPDSKFIINYLSCLKSIRSVPIINLNYSLDNYLLDSIQAAFVRFNSESSYDNTQTVMCGQPKVLFLIIIRVSLVKIISGPPFVGYNEWAINNCLASASQFFYAALCDTVGPTNLPAKKV